MLTILLIKLALVIFVRYFNRIKNGKNSQARSNTSSGQ